MRNAYKIITEKREGDLILKWIWKK